LKLILNTAQIDIYGREPYESHGYRRSSNEAAVLSKHETGFRSEHPEWFW